MQQLYLCLASTFLLLLFFLFNLSQVNALSSWSTLCVRDVRSDVCFSFLSNNCVIIFIIFSLSPIILLNISLFSSSSSSHPITFLTSSSFTSTLSSSITSSIKLDPTLSFSSSFIFFSSSSSLTFIEQFSSSLTHLTSPPSPFFSSSSKDSISSPPSFSTSHPTSSFSIQFTSSPTQSLSPSSFIKASIFLPPCTPYHDGLFFFDIAFPEDYPNKPPKIHYISFGYRLNPNLYSNGYVCLSLLNTWTGKKFERWDPATSTLLQVLVSIQALVLNEKPLYNEPAYRVLSRSLFESKSRAYNGDVFVLTCYSAVCLIRKPPKNFEEFVKEHFRERGCVLLAACKEYANGRVRVGYYGYNSNNNNTAVIKVTESFQKLLRRAYGCMFKALLECGASLQGFVAELEVDKQVKGKRSSAGKGIIKKAMGKIKQALGWKKKKNNTD